MNEKTQKAIGSVVLITVILSFTALFISRCGFAIVPVTTRYAYRPILKYRWETQRIVKHFPDSIPDEASEVKFFYQAGLMQGGTTIELRMKLPQKMFEAIIHENRTRAKLILDHSGNDIDTSTEKKVYFAPPLNFRTVSRDELTDEYSIDPLPADYQIFLLHIDKHKSYWNHGQTAAIAFSRLNQEIIYRAEVW